MGLARKDGSGTLLAAGDRLSGVLGSVAALITVEHGYEPAVAAALGAVADAIVVADVGSAVDALRLLKDDEAGRAGLLVGAPPGRRPSTTGPCRDAARRGPPGTRSRDRPAGCAPACTGCWPTSSSSTAWPTPARLVEAAPAWSRSPATATCSASTGRRRVDLDADTARGAGRRRRGRRAAGRAEHRLDRLRFALHPATRTQQVAGRDVQAALDRLHESDARMAAVAEQLGQLGAQARAARGEAERLERAIDAASEQLNDDREALAELEERLTNAEIEPTQTTSRTPGGATSWPSSPSRAGPPRSRRG